MTLKREELLEKKWTLFLDRDGVINCRIPNAYVRNPEEFKFTNGSLAAINYFSSLFHRIIIVTNQQGIAKGLMTVEELHMVHYHMISKIEQSGGIIDNIYFCPSLATDSDNCRKPSSQMALWAQRDFPDIDFSHSIMVGDMPSDILFGKNLNMSTIHVSTIDNDQESSATYSYRDLYAIASDLILGQLKNS